MRDVELNYHCSCAMRSSQDETVCSSREEPYGFTDCLVLGRHKTMQKFIFTFLLFTIAVPVYAFTPNDTYFAKQWYLPKINAPIAWDQTTGSSDVIVAVLDTGFDLDHPDLVANLWTNQGEVAGDGMDNDRNGFIDDLHGYDFVDDDGLPIPDDTPPIDISAIAHGTVIAGIIGAVGNNAEGIAGINWNVRLMSVRILNNEGSGSSFDARDAILYAVKNGADVINLSFTGFEIDTSFKQALQTAYDAGVVVVAAVGNAKNGEDAINVDERPIYPACHGEGENEDWVIGVASSGQTDEKSVFSNYGALCTDISAPGELIVSTTYQDANWVGFQTAFYAAGWSGTSMAVPMVAGAAALLRSAYPKLGPSQIESVLRLSADPVFGSGETNGKLGAGRLNIAKALEIAPSFFQAASVNLQTAQPRFQIAVASESGTGHVDIFTGAGKLIGGFEAYSGSFDGGVRLAMGDLNGDGQEEIVTVPASGDAPLRVFTFAGEWMAEFVPFAPAMGVDGMFVSVGDINGDGTEEIAVSTDRATIPSVRLFNLKGTLLSEFEPFPEIKNEQYVRVAMVDVNGDNTDEVVMSLGSGFEPLVRVVTSEGKLVKEFYAYAKTYRRGVFVAGGDLDGDGDDEIVTGTDQGGGPQVQIFDGGGKWLGTFFAYAPDFRGGVRLTVGRLSSWPGASIITAAGPGGGPHIRIFNGYARLIGTFFTDNDSNHRGINSAAWSF